MAATLAVALLTLAAYKILVRHLILFGRRRFVLMVLVGAVLAQAWLLLSGPSAAPAGLRVIGLIIPGILASSLARQKPVPTLASLAAVSTLTFAVARLVALL